MTTLVLGPSLGTSADACWGPTAALLRADFDVVAWELPGHGADRGPIPERLSIGDLAAKVLAAIDGPFLFAGESVGGQVGLELLLTAPDRVLGAVLCCTAAKIGTRSTWADRVAYVRGSGTAGLVPTSAQRWFASGFREREPERASALLQSLRDVDDDGYVAVCGALATYDVRTELGGIAAPVVAVAGGVDMVCPPSDLTEIADGVQRGRLVVLDGVAHQAPAEAPEMVATLIRELAKEIR